MDFRKIRTIAVVGISADPSRDSYRVGSYLQGQGYRIIPVNPALPELLGEKCYPDLRSVPEEVYLDAIDIFRKPEAVPEIVKQAVERGVPVIWMQKGVISIEGARLAEEAGLEVVMDRCMMVEHKKAGEVGRV